MFRRSHRVALAALGAVTALLTGAPAGAAPPAPAVAQCFDYLAGRARVATQVGTEGNDDIRVQSGAVLAALGGVDRAAADDITAPVAACLGNGNDSFSRTTGRPDQNVRFSILGNDGDDGLFGQAANDIIDGGNGNDTLGGRGGDDLIYGSTGNDTVIGNDGNDYLHAGGGDDQVFGDFGNDFLDGGGGIDFLDGGPGIDSCVMRMGTQAINCEAFV